MPCCIRTLQRSARHKGGSGGLARAASVWWAAAVLLAAAIAGCSKAPPVARKPVEVAFYWTSDARGRLEPCGCFTGQNGGLTRIATFLRSPEMQMTQQPPLALPLTSIQTFLHTPGDAREHLLADAGNAIAGPEDYQVIQYRYLQQAFARMGYLALNMGAGEAQLPVEALRKLGASSPVPMISANLLDRASGQRIFAPYRIVEEQGYRVAFVGVLSDVPEENLGAGLAVEPMKPALAKLLPEIKQRADIIVLLAYADEAAMRALADEFYELGVILGGKVKEPSQALTRQNRSVVLWTTNETKALGMLAARIDGPGKLTAEAFNIKFIDEAIPQDEGIAKFSQDYRDEVRRTVLSVDDPARVRADAVPGVQPAAGYVGSGACVTCHAGAYEVWRNSKHARAFQSLVVRESDADPSCLGCHTVGFGAPTGYRREFKGTKLVDVGCESCHGPGSEHVSETTRQPSLTGDKLLFRYRPLAAADCAGCHYGEFSRPFVWSEFWPQIQHGKEPAKSRNIRFNTPAWFTYLPLPPPQPSSRSIRVQFSQTSP